MRTPTYTIQDLVDYKLESFFEQEHAAIIEDKDGLPLKQNKNGQVYKIPDLYHQKYIDLIKERLRDNFIKNCRSEKDIDDQLEIAKKIFDERSNNIRCWKNVKRQEYEIRKFELRPGEIKLDSLMTQMADNMPFVYEDGSNAHNKTGNVSRNIYGGDEVAVGLSPYNFITGSNSRIKSEVERVKYRDNALIHTSMPPKNYRNIVFDTRAIVLDDVRINDERLKVFLECGREDLTDEEKASIKTRNKTRDRIVNNFEELGDAIHQITKWAGRGVLSSSKASDSKIYKDFLARRNELISNMLWKAGPNAQDSSFYLKVLQMTNDDIMDEATFQKMQKLIADELHLEDNAVKAELEAFNKKLNDINNSMLDGLQKHVDEDDRLWKYRCLQLFLLLTPIGAFSIAGQVFSYIDPLMELIGPLFDAEKTLGKGLGDMAASNVLGPLGKIVEAFRVDEGIQLFFDKTPIVSDLCEIFDFITDNDLSQSALGAASPLQSSPIALLAPAALYSFFRADTEMTQYQKVSAYEESQRKALEEVFKEFEKGQEIGFEKDAKGNIVIGTKDFKNGKHAGLEERVKKFAGKRMAAAKEAYLEGNLIEFLANLDELESLRGLDSLFGGLKFKIKNDLGGELDLTISEIVEYYNKNGGNKEILYGILDDVNSDAKKRALDQLLLFDSIWLENRSEYSGNFAEDFATNLKIFLKERSVEKKKDLCDEAIERWNFQFITNRAIELELTDRQEVDKIYAEKSIAEISEFFEKKLLDIDIKNFLSLAKAKIPNSAVSEPKATPLTIGPLFHGAAAGAA